jgi:hypothetical protein
MVSFRAYLFSIQAPPTIPNVCGAHHLQHRLQQPLLQSIVFSVVSPGLVDGVLGFILDQFSFHCLKKIHSQFAAEISEINENVGQFGFSLPAIGG